MPQSRNTSRNVLVAALVGAIVVFAVQNAEPVQVEFLVWSFVTRRAVLIFGMLGIGALMGWLIATSRH